MRSDARHAQEQIKQVVEEERAQTKEEEEQINRDWDKAVAEIKAKQRAEGYIDCPRCDDDGFTDEDLDEGIDRCWMCRGVGFVRPEEISRRTKRRAKKLEKEQEEEKAWRASRARREGPWLH